MWTRFMDMHSGGGAKEPPYEYIYIEADREKAEVIFYNRFGHNPNRVSCTCCGDDYSISCHESLSQLTGYDRNCRHLKTPIDENGRYKNNDPVIEKSYYLENGEEPPEGYEVASNFLFSGREYQTLEDYLKREDVLCISSSEISDEEKQGELPEQGYIWVD